MKIRVVAVGGKKKGPEYDLILDYKRRTKIIGKSFGFGEVQITEIDERRHKSYQEIESILSFISKAKDKNLKIVSLDSLGTLLTSENLADLMTSFVSERVDETIFFIGGPDGLPPKIVEASNFCISFGRLTYPYLLVRVMLLEQIYRAVTIIAKHPYHRG